MLSSERERIARRQTRRRLRRAGDTLTGVLTLDGGSINSGASETVYGMTEAQAEILVGGDFTGLHLHQSSAGQRPAIRYDFGGEVGQLVSYSDVDVDLYFAAAMLRAGSVTGLTVSVEQPSILAGTEFRVYRKAQCQPPAWDYVDGCHVVLPEGACEITVEFGLGTYAFAKDDELVIGCLMLDAGMVRAQNGTVLMEVSWDA